MLAGSDGRAHQKAVKLGIRNGDDVQIVEGVTASDKVVSTRRLWTARQDQDQD